MKVLAALAVVSACMISTNASAYYAVAIVKTSDGGWSSGWSWNADSQEAAEAAALRRCHANRKGQCHIIAGGKKGCFALAMSNEGNGYGTGWNNPSQGGAASVAIVECISRNPAGCFVEANLCDTTNGFEEENMTAADKQAMNNAFERAMLYRVQRRAREREIAAQNQMAQMQQLIQQTFPSITPRYIPQTVPAPPLRFMPAPTQQAPTRTPYDPCKGPIACAVR